jgi:hypothetical protein
MLICATFLRSETEEETDLLPASGARSDQVPARFRAVLTFLSWLEAAAGPLAATERTEFAMLSARLDTRVPGLGSALAAKVTLVFSASLKFSLPAK